MENDVLYISDMLRKPFPVVDLEWRISRAGYTRSGDKIYALVLTYVDARAVMRRLDDVVGMENWKASFRREGEGFLCTLSIKLNDEWVWKEDGSDLTDFESFKGGISKSFIRAANMWGIGRYLYDLPEMFANVHENGKHRDSFKDQNGKKVWFKWDAPVDKIPEEMRG